MQDGELSVPAGVGTGGGDGGGGRRSRTAACRTRPIELVVDAGLLMQISAQRRVVAVRSCAGAGLRGAAPEGDSSDPHSVHQHGSVATLMHLLGLAHSGAFCRQAATGERDLALMMVIDLAHTEFPCHGRGRR